MPPDKLDKLKGILALLKEDTVSSAQLTPLLAALVKAVQQAVLDTKKVSQHNDGTIVELRAELESAIAQLQGQSDTQTKKLQEQTSAVLAKAQTALDEIKAIQVKDGEDGQDGEDGAPGNDGSPDTPEQIADKINSLPTDDPDCQIDASHIKNLPVGRSGGIVHGGIRNTRIYSGNTLIAKAMQALEFTGAGVSATVTAAGTVIITVPGSSSSITPVDEALTDSGDHTNFTISHTPLAATLLIINQNTGQAVPTSAYTNTTTSVVFGASQAEDDGTGTLVTPTFRARYFY